MFFLCNARNYLCTLTSPYYYETTSNTRMPSLNISSAAPHLSHFWNSGLVRAQPWYLTPHFGHLPVIPYIFFNFSNPILSLIFRLAIALSSKWGKIKIGTGLNPSFLRAPFSAARRVRGSFFEFYLYFSGRAITKKPAWFFNLSRFHY